MSEPLKKEDALAMIEGLPDGSTWDDLMYAIYVRKSVEAGMADSKAGRTVSMEEVLAKFGITE